MQGCQKIRTNVNRDLIRELVREKIDLNCNFYEKKTFKTTFF